MFSVSGWNNYQQRQPEANIRYTHTRKRKDGRPFVRDGVTLENELRDFANCNRGPGKQSVYICFDLREFVKEGKRLPLSLHTFSTPKPKFSILFAFCFRSGMW